MQRTPFHNNSFFQGNMIELYYVYVLSIMVFVGAVLTTALFFQFAYHELPCPLCLLQRVAYFGICFSAFLTLRNGYSLRHEGLMLLVTVLLLIISTRQTLLDIYPREGHQYIGTAIFGLHMPVWSIVISVFLILLYAMKCCIFGSVNNLERVRIESYPTLKKISVIIMWCIIILSAVNLVASFLQCGFHSCHTSGYQLL